MTGTFITPLTNVDTAFRSEVNLECEVSNPMADCKWYKNGQIYGFGKADGQKRILHLPKISHANEGEYECRFENESSKARVTVKGYILIIFLPDVIIVLNKHLYISLKFRTEYRAI